MGADARAEDGDVEGTLLTATVDDLIARELALQQRAGEEDYLVFPSEFGVEHPEMPNPDGAAVAFAFEGAVQSIYATLAVRLAYSEFFARQGMWRNAATYSVTFGGHCGMYLSHVDEGQGELTLFFDADAPEFAEYHFEQYVHRHLERRAVPDSVERRRIYSCRECGERVSDRAVEALRARGEQETPCLVCQVAVSLLDGTERMARLYESRVEARVVEMDEAAERTMTEQAALSSVVGATQTPQFEKWAGPTTDHATLAIVFTDMVGSTPMGQELGNAAATDIRDAHLGHMGRLVAGCNGWVANEKGDGVVATFHTVVEAVDFAVAALADPGPEDISIRVGVHLGGVRKKGTNVSGNAVAYCARVEGYLDGVSGICVSDPVKHELDVSGGPEQRARVWSQHRGVELKGFPDRHTLWTLKLD